MKKLIALALIIACAFSAGLHAQTVVATPKATPDVPKAVAVAPKAVAASPAEKAKKAKKTKKEPAQKENTQKENKSPANQLFGQSATGLNTNERQRRKFTLTKRFLIRPRTWASLAAE
jgi:tRNA C32,U32 (ribose-2'-O)-methylase TrmJ